MPKTVQVQNGKWIISLPEQETGDLLRNFKDDRAVHSTRGVSLNGQPNRQLEMLGRLNRNRKLQICFSRNRSCTRTITARDEIDGVSLVWAR